MGILPKHFLKKMPPRKWKEIIFHPAILPDGMNFGQLIYNLYLTINKNFTMTREEIIRSELKIFVEYKLNERFTRVDAHKIFIDKMKSELFNYYSSESKMI